MVMRAKHHATSAYDVTTALMHLQGNETYDLIVLDEMTYVLKYGWLSWEEVRDTLDQRPAGMHVMVTGRYAPAELVAYADLVSEMVEVKHPYQAGIKAQKGIEF